ncbi:MAG TPA: hypothetical protein DCY20_11095 [Firmicutes bacterium]|nr:hypothetical protein [Bacillota bacterium]
MSHLLFIAAPYPLPTLDLSHPVFMSALEAKIRGLIPPEFEIDPNDVIEIYEQEDDLDELQIYDSLEEDNLTYYIQAPHYYEINYRYTDRRAQQLIDYLNKHLKPNSVIYIGSIWLDEYKTPEHLCLTSTELNVSTLAYLNEQMPTLIELRI